MLETGLLLNGRSVPADRDRTFERGCPVAPGAASRAAAASLADAVKMVEAAGAAFPAWAETGPNHRRELLNKAAELLVARSEDFVEAMVAETGCAENWARFNCRLGAEMLIEAGAMTTRILGETIPADRPGTLAMALRQPAGVSLGIAPWNAPVVLGVRAVAMPLACGNTAILKASELSPATHVLIGEVLQEAGLPDGAINVLTNAAEDSGPLVEAMIAHPTVRRVNFTGSTRVGRLIGEMCGRHLKPCVLELGGKAPLVVLADADVVEAARAAAFGAFMHQGQICMSTERAVVLEPVAEAFVARLAERARAIRACNPTREKAPLGALVTPAAAARIGELIEDALGTGARLAAGGGVDGHGGQPTGLGVVSPP
ncbi:MAG: aldehyde dehydrogenase family protein, partial [Betaproteobacteria bacterium]